MTITPNTVAADAFYSATRGAVKASADHRMAVFVDQYGAAFVHDNKPMLELVAWTLGLYAVLTERVLAPPVGANATAAPPWAEILAAANARATEIRGKMKQSRKSDDVGPRLDQALQTALTGMALAQACDQRLRSAEARLAALEAKKP